MEPHSLIVLIVSEDRKFLRHLSRFLTTFGYRSQAACGAEAASAVLERAQPDIVLLDGSRGWAPELCRRISTASTAKPIQTLLMLERADVRQLVDALAAGVDDFLQKPVVYGELLARMRAAARTLKCERSARRQEGRDPLTGLMNPSLFEEKLRHLSVERAACVVVDLDWLDGVNRLHGWRTGDALICRAAQALEQLPGEATLASLGGGRFGTLLPGATVLEAESWAEQARQAIGQIEFDREGETLRVTASAGLATMKDGSGEEALAKACEALRLAKQSGRNCTARAGQFAEETRAWSELAMPGKLFERTRARDVMTSLPLILQETDAASRAARLLERTQLEALPVVDGTGALVGVVTSEMPLDDPEACVADVMTREVATFEEDATFLSLLEFFTSDARPLAIIVHRKAPTGLLTPDRLALLSQAVTLDDDSPAGSDTCTASSVAAGQTAEAVC
jgi:diguanylate cyclase (GGDEF)-like protein